MLVTVHMKEKGPSAPQYKMHFHLLDSCSSAIFCQQCKFMGLGAGTSERAFPALCEGTPLSSSSSPPLS